VFALAGAAVGACTSLSEASSGAGTSTTRTEAVQGSNPPPAAADGLAPVSPVLSAFFGLDALPPIAAAICPQAPGQDGVVVNVSDELEAAAVEPSQWVVVTAAGRRAVPVCASLKPAIDPGERRTVLLIGDLGSRADPPRRVEIPDGLPTTDPARHNRYRAIAFEPVAPLADGPSIVIAEHVDRPALDGPVTGPDGCPSTTQQVLRVAWAGGVSRPDGALTDNTDAARYHVAVRTADGSIHEVSPDALADVNDNDNYHQLCLATTDPAAAVRADPGAFVDPNGDPNPATNLAIAP